tara:strand:- start:1015 stop:4662 length:3648 start_codon:yes stop_codon:yes gene_type:complete
METSYVDTILLEANRKSSPEYLASFAGNASNPNSWTNSVGAGVKLEIGDKISVHSAYISEIGNESATIEIKGKQATNNTGVGQSYTSEQNVINKTINEKSNIEEALEILNDNQQGNFHWNTISSSETNKIRDDEINLTHSYYKCNQGDNYISLPRSSTYFDLNGYPDAEKPWSQWNSASNGSVVDVNPYRYGGDYSQTRYGGNASGWGYNDRTFTTKDRTEIINDGNRYTLFIRSNFTNFAPFGKLTTEALMGHRDPALADYKWYKKTVNYKIKNGFNSPANVADSFSNQMNNVNKIEKYAYGDETNGATVSVGQDSSNQLQLTAESPTNELFPCSTAYNSYWYAKHWFDDSYSSEIVIDLNSVSWGLENNMFEFNGTHFQSGAIIPGMICTGVLNTSASETPAGLGNLMGAFVTSVRDEHGGTSFISFDRETTAAGGPEDIVFFFSNESQMPLYDSCYSTIGYKRPEIQQAGRDLEPFYKDGNNEEQYAWTSIDGCFTTNVEMDYPNNASTTDQPRSLLFSGIPWTEDNLLRVKKLLEAEELYPELFDYSNMSASQQALVGANNEGIMSPDKVRFLWMNDGHSPANVDDEIATSGSGILTQSSEYISVSASDYAKITKGDLLYSPSWNGGNGFNSSNTWVTSKEVKGTYRIYISSRLVNYANGTVRYTNAKLGDDNYYNYPTNGCGCGAVFFDYNKDRKDIRGGEGQEISRFNSLTYGFAMKYSVTVGDQRNFYIGFSVEEQFHNKTFAEPFFNGGKITKRSVGFDKHFNAYGTAAILLTNGLCSLWGSIYDNELIDFGGNASWRLGGGNASIPSRAHGTPDIFHSWQAEPSDDGLFYNASTYGPAPPASGYWASLFNEIYMGANKPQLGFDSLSSRFQFLDLHTSELIGTDSTFVNSGSDVADGITPVYKVNKRLSRLNYSPNFIPYNNVFKINNWRSASDTAVAELDKNITPYSIMDAMGGIFFEDYGVDEANWKQSLWELLGFTYDQFHQTSTNRLARFNNTEITTSTPTTNALVKASDTQLWVKEGLSDIQVFNTPKALYPSWVFPAVFSASGRGGLSQPTHFEFAPAGKTFAMPGNKRLPAISQSCSSTSIIAKNLPRKMLSPIYLIQSDIINPMYLGGREGNVTLPIVGVVNKSAGYGDFYTGAEDGTIFTNTIPRTIQNIKTSIVDADGTASRVDDSCCIIYKIQKQIADNSQVLNNILNPPKTPPQ